jgi:hypothetical protein
MKDIFGETDLPSFSITDTAKMLWLNYGKML